MALKAKIIESIKQDYEGKALSTKEIVKKYSIARSTLNRLIKKGHWKKRHAEKRHVKKETKKGRPTSYDPKYAKQALPLCLLGYTDKKLAEFFEVNELTINRWKKRHPEFSKSIKKGKSPANAKVASALYQKAIGFEKEVTKVFQHKGKIITEQVLEYFPPDTGAAAFFLKNKEPELWRDKREVALEDRTIRTTLPGQKRAKNDEDFSKLVEEQIGN